MARSRKDGRGGGAHKDRRNREVWSRSWKAITHRYERRMARIEIQGALHA